jgi:hypothetical protein
MESTEYIEEHQPTEQKKKEKTSSLITILETKEDYPDLKNVIVKKDNMEYTVIGGVKGGLSHWSSFAAAMMEVSERLFENKLTKRADEGRTDFDTLVKLVEEHKREMTEKFRL